MKRTRAISSAVRSICLVTSLALFVPGFAVAQEAGGADTGDQELAKKLANPLTDMVSVPLQFNWINGVGPNKELRTLIYFQPVVPISISENWNMIGRLVVPYLAQPAAYGGSAGMSDVIAQAFFSPKTKGTFTWGVGPMFYMPVTNDPTLGYGKWSAGPTGAVMKQTANGFTFGMLANNVWSFAKTGTTDRPDVNMGYFQPVIAYSSANGVTVTFSTEAIADWNAPKGDRWSVPITAGISKITRFGPMPMSVQVGAGYYVAKPTGGPNWQLRTTFTLLMPRKG